MFALMVGGLLVALLCLLLIRRRRERADDAWAFVEGFCRSTGGHAQDFLHEYDEAISAISLYDQAVSLLDAEVEEAQAEARRQGLPEEEAGIDANSDVIQAFAQAAALQNVRLEAASAAFEVFVQAQEILLQAANKARGQRQSSAKAFYDAKRAMEEVQPVIDAACEAHGQLAALVEARQSARAAERDAS